MVKNTSQSYSTETWQLKHWRSAAVGMKISYHKHTQATIFQGGILDHAEATP